MDASLAMMNLDIQPSTAMFPQDRCYRPRRPNAAYTPRSKVPPNWQRAQSFVKALIVARIGNRPWYTMNPYWMSAKYQKEYVRLREEYRLEDFPINP